MRFVRLVALIARFQAPSKEKKRGACQVPLRRLASLLKSASAVSHAMIRCSSLLRPCHSIHPSQASASGANVKSRPKRGVVQTCPAVAMLSV